MQDQQKWNAIVPFDIMPAATAMSQYLSSYWGNYYKGVLQSPAKPSCTYCGSIPAGATVDSINTLPGFTYTLKYPNVLDVNGNPTAYDNANGLLSPGGEWHVSKPISAFQDQLTFKKSIEGGHNVSLGLYFANYSQTNNWYFTDILTDVQDNPHFVDMTVNSGSIQYFYHTGATPGDRKSTRLNSSHGYISYAVFCLKKKKNTKHHRAPRQNTKKHQRTLNRR